jgi:N-acetylmuramoyl-L-alanine amidase
MKIFIDPGHGGPDSGAVGNGMRESDIVLEVALHLGKILEAAGLKVQFSRTTDISPPDRAAAANSWGADLVVSIHANAGGGTGVETIIPTASPNNPKRDLQENRRFAEIMSNTLANAFGMRVRRANGVMLETETRHSFIGILRNTKAPAVLVEMAFIDSPLTNPDVEILRNRRKCLAEALAAGVFECLGIERPVEQGAEVRGQRSEDRFDAIEQMPEWAQPTIQKLVDLGHLRGDGGSLDLSLDMIRIFVIHDRVGVYD